jgi:hypothetical protein
MMIKVQQDTSITPIEFRILSEISPEDAQKLVSFLSTITAPKRINPCLTWEASHHIDNLPDTVRTFLFIRASDWSQ